MKKIFLILALMAAVILSVTACDKECDGNCDKDYIVKVYPDSPKNNITGAIRLTEPSLKNHTIVVLEIISKKNTKVTGSNFEAHYGKHKPTVLFHGNSKNEKALIQNVEKHFKDGHLIYKVKKDDYSSYIYYGGSISDSWPHGAVYAYAVKQIPNPSSSDQGRIPVAFYHADQKKGRKFHAYTWYLDVTQNPPVQVTRDQYYKLQWVKDLKAQGK